MSNPRVAVLLYHNGQISETDEGVTFVCANRKMFRVDTNITFEELKAKVHEKLKLGERNRVSEIKYRYPLCIGSGCVRYSLVEVTDDDDVQSVFHIFYQHPNLGAIELYAEIEDVEDDSWPMNLSANELSTPSTWPDWTQYQPQQDEPNQYQEPAPQAFGCTQVESPITGLQINAAGPSSQVVERSHDSYGPSATAEEYIGDYTENEEGVELGYSDSSDNSERDVAEHPNLTVGSSGSLPPYEPPSHMRSLHLEVMHEPEFSEYAHTLDRSISWDACTGELAVGMQFQNKEAVLSAVKHYHIQRSLDYKVKESTTTTYSAKCKSGSQECNWTLRATFLKKKQLWEIMKIVGPHTCSSAIISQDHCKLDSNMISTCILPLVQADPSITVSVLIAEIRSRYKYITSYRKAWKAKQKAIIRVFGNWEESYNDLPKWLAALQQFVPGTIIELQTHPAYHGSRMVQGKRIFHRLFWAFKSCIDGFQFCKPIVQIDGTFLYGKYKGTLLLAIAQDGNQNILPIAFAIVEGETADAWLFFLTNLRRHLAPQRGICLISDRHESIKSAIRRCGRDWTPPQAYPVYCIRHIAANFMKRFNNKEMRRQVVNMGYALTQFQFNWYYENLRGQNAEVTNWLDNIPREKWAQAFDGGRRYGHMTTNLAECINSVLKGTRHLPITALVQSTYYRLAELFVRKGNQCMAMMQSGHTYSETLTKAMEENRTKANSHFIRRFTRECCEFLVEELVDPQEGLSGGQFKVRLNERWCDCGKFQALKFPCSHVIAACASVHLDYMQFVDPIYKLENIFSVYQQEFQIVGNQGYWPQYDGPELCPDPGMRREPRGRPKSTRIHNEMDLREKGHAKRCGLCRNEGHSRTNCPYRSGTSRDISHE